MPQRRFLSGLLGLLVSLWIGGVALAQPASLVKDLNTTKARTLGARDITPIVQVGANIFFAGDDGGTGMELWKTDAATGAVSLVKDICPGSCPSYPFALTAAGGRLFFRADDGTHGVEIWTSDGTAAGTFLAAELNRGFADSFYGWLGAIGNELFFAGSDRTRGTELWALDTGTLQKRLVAEINPGRDSSWPLPVAAGGGRLLFLAVEVKGYNPRLWISDGTTAGTHPVVDPDAQEPRFNDQRSSGIALPDGSFLFSADGSQGNELWRTDGTAAGTAVVKDLNPNGDSRPQGFLSWNGKIWFGASSDTSGGLYATDGTAAGTVLVQETGTVPGQLAAAGNQLFFITGTFGGALWKTDGTTTAELTPSGAQGLAPLGSSLLFLSGGGFSATLRLEKTDGTDAGTVVLKDLGPQDNGCVYKLPMTTAGGRVYFQDCNSDVGQQAWKSDGTADGTATVLSPTRTPSFPYSTTWYQGPDTYLRALGSEILFRADDDTPGTKVWKTDGTAGGTSTPFTFLPALDSWPWTQLGFQDRPPLRLKNSLVYAPPNGELWNVRNGPAAPESLLPDGVWGNLARLGNLAVFVRHIDTAYELWKTDGTGAGTARISSQIGTPMGVAGSQLYLRTSDGQLWKTDGTSPGTVLVKDLGLASDGGAVSARGLLFFVVGDGATGNGTLWRTDGTDAGTLPLRTFPPSPSTGFYSSNMDRLFSLGDRVVFAVDDGTHGREIWVSDGTDAGTHLVKDANPGAGSSPGYMGYGAVAGGRLYYLADDGTHGQELWVSDGTDAGTHLVKDVNPGLPSSQGSFPTMAAVRGRLFFLADDGTHGFELWVTDGTDAGTHLVKDIVPGPGGPVLSQLTAVGNDLVFSASDGTHGGEPWTSDGTDAGTYMIQDIAPGAASSGPQLFTSASSRIYFLADDGTTGLELWTVPRSALPPTFTDVPSSHWAWASVETLTGNGVTGGCASGRYCPDALVTRAEMAVLLSTARGGAAPSPATGARFQDVPSDYWAAPWIEQLAAEGIAGGCQVSPPLYCPAASLTRAQMAVLLVVARHESTSPPTGTRFGDVPSDYWAAPWIERLAADGITGGCGGGNFCPERPVTRAEMAVFLTTTFGLALP